MNELENSLKNIKNKNCSVQVFGLGYVGFPLATRLATSGFKVRGIDVDKTKINQMKKKNI